MSVFWNILIINLVYFVSVIHGQGFEESPRSENVVQTVPICSVCKCNTINTTDYKTNLQIHCTNMILGLKNLNSIEWPTNEHNLPIDVIFEDLSWTTIEKIPDYSHIVSLSFNNNAIRTIWPGAFSDLPNLKYLQISRNQLSGVTPDIFHNLNNLIELDLSYNKLTDFNALDFSELKNLKTLYLGNNHFEKIPSEALEKLTSLQQLDLSGNQMYFLNLGSKNHSWLQHLKYFDLSSNKLSTIYFKDTFENAITLEYLNLSSNAIVAIETNVFQDCVSLKVLDLSNNALSALPDLAPSVEMLYLQLNAFKKWPNLPINIKAIDLSRNNLYENYDGNYVSFDKLEYLNISGNMLSEFNIKRPLSNLKYLDISYNILPEVPQSLSVENLPKLQDLYIDGNPMEKLSFASDIELKKLSAKYLHKLISLDASGFSKLKAKHSSDLYEDLDESSECLDLIISHCENLEIINEDTFQGVKLCHLDISYNKLSKLKDNVAEWENIRGGVNLQGNYWDCTCELQWILDIILKDLYINHPTYLHEFRCSSPRPLQGMRLVHWYNRQEKAFCSESKYLSNYVLLQSTNDNSDINVLMSGGGTVIAILVAIGVALLLCIGLIIYLVRGKYKHNHAVRRQMMKKRQAMSDAKMLNRISYKQNDPLNTVPVSYNK